MDGERARRGSDRLSLSPGHDSGASTAGPARMAALPDRLRADVESLSGVSMSGVRVVHDSPLPTDIGARAFARAERIYLAHGEEASLPHEAWHVAQQATGRVRRTSRTADGQAVNDDPRLEKEADAMARRVRRRVTPAIRRSPDDDGLRRRPAAPLEPIIQRDRVTPDGGQLPEVNVGKYVRSREAYVYIVDQLVYKCYANLEKGQDALDMLNAAVEADVPVPKFRSFRGTLTRDGVEPPKNTVPVLVLRMELLTGKTLYLSKPGGPKKFANEIDSITDKGQLRRMLSDLNSAKEAKMTDPQLFITNSNRIVFFDVHVGRKGATGSALDEAIAAVDARIKLL